MPKLPLDIVGSVFSGRALRHLGGCCSWSRLGGTKKLPTTSSSTGDWSKLRLPILLSGAFYDAAQSFTTRRAWRTSNEKPRTQIASKKYCMIQFFTLWFFILSGQVLGPDLKMIFQWLVGRFAEPTRLQTMTFSLQVTCGSFVPALTWHQLIWARSSNWTAEGFKNLILISCTVR